MVCNVSSGMILGYIVTHGKHKVTLEEMFKRLSVQMGGDGKTISKKQLDAYINKAESGNIKISSSELKALKKLQAKWDDISKGKDTISFADMKGFSVLLMNIYVSSFQSSDDKDDDDSKNEFKAYIKQTLGISDNKAVDKSDLEAKLKSLLSDKTSDDSNGDLVDALTNMIAVHDSNANSTISEEV